MIEPEVPVGDNGGGFLQLVLGPQDRVTGTAARICARVGSSAVEPVGSQSLKPLLRPTKSRPRDLRAPASGGVLQERREV
jgi:hypothetical protein